jgi:hypothetical protein
MYILHTRQTYTLFTTTTSLSRTYEEDLDAIVRQKAYCTYRKTDSCRIFPLSLSSFVSIYIRIQTHRGERGTFFSPTVFFVLKCSQERRMTEPRQKSFEGFAFLAYVESLSLSPSNRSFLCPPHPVSSLPIPELLHIRGTFSG